MTKFHSRVALAVLAAAEMGVARAQAPSVTITAPTTKFLRGLYPGESADIAGAIKMSDARPMVLTQQGCSIVAKLKGMRR